MVGLPYLRDEFLLDPDIIFLNHGSFGACPRPVFEAYQHWQGELERQPVEFLSRRLRGLLAQARQPLGDLVCSDPTDLVYVPNATTAVNAVARSLVRALSLGPGDEILTTDHEYGAAARAWRFVCRHSGARLVEHPLSIPVTTQEVVADALWAGVTDRTRVIFLSHITSPTALVLPVAEICRRARDAGIMTVIDGAHALGQIDLDMASIGADFYIANAHKWLLAPKGCAFLYARPDRQRLLDPLVVSWGWDGDRPGRSTFLDYFEWTGTADPAAYLSVPTAIRFQQQHDWRGVRTACRALLADLRRRIVDLSGLRPPCPDTPGWTAQMISLPLPPGWGEPARLQARLWDEFRIEVPVLAWNGKTLIRISIQAYNSPADGDRLLAALTRIKGPDQTDSASR
jgi:isopenicillin-N epimerase